MKNVAIPFSSTMRCSALTALYATRGFRVLRLPNIDDEVDRYYYDREVDAAEAAYEKELMEESYNELRQTLLAQDARTS